MAAAGGRCGISVLPRQYRCWISPDPGFEAKATVILDLYQGVPPRAGGYGRATWILSVDAKPSIQARGRAAPAAPGKPVRVEHGYVRHGALALLAALDVHTGKCSPPPRPPPKPADARRPGSGHAPNPPHRQTASTPPPAPAPTGPGETADTRSDRPTSPATPGTATNPTPPTLTIKHQPRPVSAVFRRVS